MANELTNEELEALLEAQMCIPSPYPNTIMVNTSLLPLPTRTSTAATSFLAVRFLHLCLNSVAPYQDMPSSDSSLQALEFIGFDKPTAWTILTKWIQYRNEAQPDRDGLYQHVRHHIQELDDEDYQNVDPRVALTEFGLNQKTQDALTDPIFALFIGTGSLHDWTEHVLRMRYVCLKMWSQRVKLAAKATLNEKRAAQESDTGKAPEE